MKAWLAVFVGGACGGVARYEVSLWLPMAGGVWGTTAVNLLGSFLLALITFGVALRFDLPNWLILALGTGFVGAFTTWSTLMVQTMRLAAFGVLALDVSVGLIGAAMGYWAGVHLQKAVRTW